MISCLGKICKSDIMLEINKNYRLMHTLFHIRTVIIQRDRYRPEGFSLSINIGRGMITVLIWKKACINLFITYFNIELINPLTALGTYMSLVGRLF